jgi:hypothetical protein
MFPIVEYAFLLEKLRMLGSEIHSLDSYYMNLGACVDIFIKKPGKLYLNT